MDLPEVFKAKALAELREDDSMRKQSLDQFRDWLTMQSHIKHCRTDDSFLLRFLRVKKFSNAEAFKMLERFLVAHQVYPQWFDNLTLDDDRIREIYQSGYVFPLKERDQNGCRVIMVQASKLDPSKFDSIAVYRVFSWIFSNFMEEPETQVAGFVFVLDCKDLSLEQISLFSFGDLKNFISCIQNAIPCRQKLALFLNFPSIGVALADFIKSYLSKKLKERTHFCTGIDKLYEHLDKKILPKEYGGEDSISDMMKSFETVIETQKAKLKSFDDLEIDLDRVKDFKADTIDSFKKLEVD